MLILLEITINARSYEQYTYDNLTDAFTAYEQAIKRVDVEKATLTTAEQSTPLASFDRNAVVESANKRIIYDIRG